jgi:hypothetical protein
MYCGYLREKKGERARVRKRARKGGREGGKDRELARGHIERE